MSDETFFKKLEILDLEPIIFKLVKDPDSGLPWSVEKADETAILYKQYLFLCWKYRNSSKTIAPNKTVDQFWHQHQLDTQKYRMDCELLFAPWWQILIAHLLQFLFLPLGLTISAGYMEHFPYLGMRGEDDEIALEKAFEEGKKLLALHFPQ
jgi:hypothetical protein